jgi:phosphoribosyl 1,2-cyclic phosphodiesterase
MDVRFWGVRGSYPVAGPDTVRYGGNTSCVEARLDDGTRIVLDAGTGIRGLGMDMMSNGFADGDGEVAIMLSHTHWDHIMGMPFFEPAKVKGNKIVVHSRKRETCNLSLNDIFVGQQDSDYCDHAFGEMKADFEFVDILEGDMFAIGSATVTCARLNHPCYDLGYRIVADGAVLVYITDTSPFDDLLIEDQYIADPKAAMHSPDSPQGKLMLELHNRLLALMSGADLVIYDTFFEPEGYRTRPHWGHSTPDHAIANCTAAGAKKLALFHHAPENTDDAMDLLARKYADQTDGTELDVFVAVEGHELRCGDDAVH